MSTHPTRRLTILGSTGSIGRQALDVVRKYPDRFELLGLSAGSDARTLAAQATEFRPEYVALESTETGPLEGSEARVVSGSGAAARLAAEPSDTVLNGIVGFAGPRPPLPPCKQATASPSPTKSRSSPEASG